MKPFLLIGTLIFIVCYINVDKEVQVKTIYDESALSQFIRVSAVQNPKISEQRLDSILKAVSKDSLVFHQTINYLDKSFSDPNSLFRNELLYDQILKEQMASKWFTALEKENISRRSHLLHQNDVGTLANDFEFYLPKGERKTMHSIEAVQLLLFFYNPECEACRQMSLALKNSKVISKAVTKGRLRILCIYIDNDLSIWYKHLNEYPFQWLQGRDEDEHLYKNDIYDLKAIPTIYLLDQNKKVKLKDCTSIEELERNIH